jgi:uncharacterized protein
VKRNRIGLTMRKDGGGPQQPRAPRADDSIQRPRTHTPAPKPQPAAQGAFGAALADALRKK